MIKDFEDVVKDSYSLVKMDYNFHTHNYLCKHALGNVCDYVQEAINQGFKEIGISDHGHTPLMENKVYIDLDDVDNLYLPQFKEAIDKYGDKIKIKKGIEIDYMSGLDEYYKALYSRLDYLMLGQHYYMYENKSYFVFNDSGDVKRAIEHYNQIIEGIKTGYFKIAAHIDVEVGTFKGKCPKVVLDKLEETVIEAMKHNVFIEINANGYRKGDFVYPTDELIKIVKRLNTKIVIGSDCHKPHYLLDDCTKKVYDYCKKMNLNIVKLEEIDI